MGAPNLSSARSTISIARSTPAQKPRGSASNTSWGSCGAISEHSNHMHFKAARLAGQRVVEVEQQPVLAHLLHAAGIGTLPVRRRELHDVADVVLLVRIAELLHQAHLHTLQQIGIALAEGL